jgi:hypothetical protein
VNWSGLPVFPIIDGIALDGTNGHQNLTVFSSAVGGHVGEFQISVPIDPNYYVAQNMTINANITAIPSQDIYVDDTTVQTSALSLDIIAKTKNQITIDNSHPYLPGDTVKIGLNLTDELGQPIPQTGLTTLPQNTLYLYPNGNISLVSQIFPTYFDPTKDTGFYNYVLPYNTSSVNIIFNGSKTYAGNTYYEYQPSTTNSPILQASALSGSLVISNGDNASETFLYTNGSVTVKGTFYFNNNTSYPVGTRLMDLYCNGNFVVSQATDSAGKFIYPTTLNALNITTTNITIVWSIQLHLYDNFSYSQTAFTSHTQIAIKDKPITIIVTNTNPGPSTNYAMIIIPIVIIVGIIIGLMYFQRKRMDLTQQRDEDSRKVNETAKMNIITMLYNAKKRREAVVYTFKIYSDLIYQKYKIKPENGQTINDYAMMTVTKYGQDPLHIYPYIKLIEHVLYGALDVDDEVFNKAIDLLGHAFYDLTGGQLQYNLPTAPAPAIEVDTST